MHSAEEVRWPVLDGGPTPVTLAGETPWQHDGYRMHLAGRGARLESVRTQVLMMDEIRHDPGEALALHADRVESHGGRALHDRWATALELPLFVWERTSPGRVSWTVPGPASVAELNSERNRLLLRSAASQTRFVFETSNGEMAVGADGRIIWTAHGPSRLVAIAASGEADLERNLDLLVRRSISGLGRQRAQHAEQLQRGGAAMRSTAHPQLADAFDWAKVRADALLGGPLELDAGQHPPGEAIPLAHALLAAGLSHLPRALRRRLLASGDDESVRFGGRTAAWTGELHDAAEPGTRPELQPAMIESDADVAFDLPEVDAIASGGIESSRLASFLAGAIGTLWGVVPDALNARVTLAPDVTRLGDSAALSRLRVGRTVADVRCRSRGELVSIGIRRGAGPPIVVDCGVRGLSVTDVLVDGVSVAGSRVRFELREAHDVQFHLRGRPPLSSAPS